MMMTTKTGLLRGATIELESPVPEMDGQRVRVVLEPVEEQRLSAQQQREFWQAWVERGPEGPIESCEILFPRCVPTMKSVAGY